MNPEHDPPLWPLYLFLVGLLFVWVYGLMCGDYEGPLETDEYMGFPVDRDGLKEAGYTFSNHAKCRGCKEEIEWWTTPAGRKIPMDLMQEGSSSAKSHFSTCTKAEDFRK